MEHAYRSVASEVLYIAKQSGIGIMQHYESDVVVHLKEDDSPVTIADKEASEFIINELAKITPDIPVVSEEQDDALNVSAAQTNRFWLIDPLDGTKSFIRKSGDFTVNIALIEHGAPVGGAIYAPLTRTSYFTAEDAKAYKQIGDNLPTSIKTRPVPPTGQVVLTSHSHQNSETEAYIEALPNVRELKPVSSSLKFCVVAEGRADIYPRFGPTMQWDVGAGHAILKAAGGLIELPDGSPFTYPQDTFKNPFFIASGSK